MIRRTLSDVLAPMCALALFGSTQTGFVSPSVDTGTPVAQQADDSAVENTDCGDDLGCFIAQAQVCGPATVLHTITVDLGPLGVEEQLTDAFGVEPGDAGACRFTLEVQQADAHLNAEAVAAMREQGASQEEIDSAEARVARSAARTVGLSGDCQFAPDALVAMLTQWQQGNFSSDDWKAGTCQGSFFGS